MQIVEGHDIKVPFSEVEHLTAQGDENMDVVVEQFQDKLIDEQHVAIDQHVSVCLSASLSVCGACVHVCMNVCVRVYAGVCACMPACMHACMYIYIHMQRVCMCIHVVRDCL